jgi:hypothetical protein
MMMEESNFISVESAAPRRRIIREIPFLCEEYGPNKVFRECVEEDGSLYTCAAKRRETQY